MAMLKLAVVVMGVLIVVATAALVGVVAQRLITSPGPAGSAVLDEPAGTHIAHLTSDGDRVALQLQGGGPDRVVMVELHSGRVVGRVALIH